MVVTVWLKTPDSDTVGTSLFFFLIFFFHAGLGDNIVRFG